MLEFLSAIEQKVNAGVLMDDRLLFSTERNRLRFVLRHICLTFDFFLCLEKLNHQCSISMVHNFP